MTTQWFPAWKQPSGALGERLRPGRDVHVWRIALTRVLGPGSSEAYGLLGALSEDELRRAAAITVDEERARFLAAHVALRDILASYTGTPPSELRFTRDGDRPALAGATGIEFSLSRSGTLALVAVAAGVRVGVDVEEVREVDHDGLAARTLRPEEAATVGEPLTFFRYWTCKEAYLKVDGTGLAGLPGPSFTLTGGDVALDDRPEWTITELDAGAGNAAALAVPARPVTVRAFDWLPGRRRAAGEHRKGGVK
ncbi:4'-phosphopantetheinyl transferase superfamily protein [Amycolatopsis sp. TNS106]|uniref:4'-phosphopantetheinyl transferase family protein n=1 Tax=Amycolatopsis sp. TNS106 TaxID=2861750 RepID=UPI001C57E3E0|nr:4'-phosphopantetheinyl transferase superfamily protein [Amycolatopsis sp. TNS106]QXV58090.1 4'-phosphopantetheinyl transferase [Amycolatopsis sp. TNS106]